MKENMRNEAIQAALVKAYQGGLSTADCAKLTANDASEVARILIEDSRQMRTARGGAA